jgi:polyisoprenoid-binding protein YceI
MVANIMNNLKNLFLATAVLLLWGCSNPADNVPAAKVSATNTTASTPAPAPTAPPRIYAVTPDNSSVEFIGSKVTGSHRGGFKKFEGELAVTDGRLANTGNKVTIDMTSIWTDTDRLTEHLKTPDFFNVAQIPIATFETTSIADQGTNTLVTGNLTLHGVTKQIQFPAEVHVSDDAVNLMAEFAINRFDFDVKYPGKPDDLIRKEVVLKLNVKAAKKA